MTLNLRIDPTQHTDFSPRITVIGVGGGGTNAVDNMIALNLQGVEFLVANTDAQQLMHSRADRRIQLGPHITQGLGAGAKPEIGRAAAEEAADELYRHLEGQHMVFITAGMGGGTGTGAAPVIARMARERNILTVGVVTKPFTFEGGRRARAADAGIEDLQQYVDTLIVIPNQNLFRLANERTGWKEAFKMADNVLYMGVRGVTDLMMAPGLVNLDFADIRTVMAEMGKAMMGTGEADGDNRAVRAAEAAISNPLLEDTSMSGARGLLINITGGEDLTLFEVDQAANRIREEVDEEANIIFGSAIDENLVGRIRVSVVATGIESAQKVIERPRLVAVGGGAMEESAAASSLGGSGQAPVQPLVAPSGQMTSGQAPGGQASSGPTPFPTLRTASQPNAGQASAGNGQPAHGRTTSVPPRAQTGQAIPHPLAKLMAKAANAAAAAQEAEAAAQRIGTEADEADIAHMEVRHAHANGGPSLSPGTPLSTPSLTASRAQPGPRNGRAPEARPEPRNSGLFNDPSRTDASAPQPHKSLFGLVTGAIRGARPAQHAETRGEHADAHHEQAAPMAPQRSEPPRAHVRQTVSDEMAIDIPAFLRRQSS